MRTEAISFRRCCCCIPLRYGLLAWGYFRLLVAGLMLYGLSWGLTKLVKSGISHANDTTGLIIITVVIIVVVVDIALGIVFIVGCHKKDPTLIKKYYYHNIFLLSVFVPLGLYHFGSMVDLMIRIEVPLLNAILYMFLVGCTLFAYISLQVYIVLLVRSQFMKLTEGCQFRFENNAIEPECSLNIENSNRVEKEDNRVSDYNKIDIENGDEIKNYVEVDENKF